MRFYLLYVHVYSCVLIRIKTQMLKLVMGKVLTLYLVSVAKQARDTQTRAQVRVFLMTRSKSHNRSLICGPSWADPEGGGQGVWTP